MTHHDPQLTRLLAWVLSHGNAARIESDGRIAIEITLVDKLGNVSFVTEYARTLKDARRILGY